MCGIAGIASYSREPDKKIVSNMLDSISHRGPDQKGLYTSSDICMGIQRLSIIDLKTGNQPIENEDGGVAVVFNGEIYNYRELTLDLQKRGHIFKTKSDTEVLVHLYELYGENMTKKLNGMFAFALWDKQKKLLFLARDPAGVKPLYFWQKGEILIFGSEVKSILSHPALKKEISTEALQAYSYLGYIPGDLSIFKGVNKLLPGHSLSFSRKGLKLKKYHSVESGNYSSGEDIDYFLEKAVLSQSMADVPLGVLLSGGVDSTLITYYLTRNTGKTINSFSIAFEEESFDESKFALEVSGIFQTKHHQENFSSKDVINLLPKILDKMDEPLADPSLIPTYKLCKLTRKFVKVALSGDGGDELFGGYPTYQGHLLVNKIQRIFPKFFSEGTAKLLKLFPPSDKNYPKTEVISRFLKGIHLEDIERHFYWMSVEGNRKILNGDFSEDYSQLIWIKMLKAKIEKFKGSAPAQFQLLDFYTYLTDDLLVKTDRASMYNSLEVRVPFLDLDVIRFAFSNKRHLDFFRTKKLLRNLLKNKVPKNIAERRKKGFGIPISKWIAGDLKKFVMTYLQNEKLYEFFNKEEIFRIWDQHLTRKQNNAKSLWMLTVFSGWLNRWY